jgi:hypothetical protein
MKHWKRWSAVLTAMLWAGSTWGACTSEEIAEMERLGLADDVIAYTCEESELLPEAPPAPEPETFAEEVGADEAEVIASAPTAELGFRQQVSVGVGAAAGSYEKHGNTFDLSGSSLVVHYHWVEYAGYTLGAEWLFADMAGSYNAADEIRYTQQSLAITAGWLLIDSPTLQLTPELVLGIWGTGHLSDQVDSVSAQPSLNGLEIPVSFLISEELFVGGELGWYDLSLFGFPESGIDIRYPSTTGKARLSQTLNLFVTYRF